MRKAVFPGSFDPFTLGHLDILKRSLLLFDEIIVGVGKNIDKQTMFSEKQRISFIEKCFKKLGANFIVRGIRNNGDFEFEKAIARTNRKLSKIETVFLLTSTQTSFISSTIVRELILNKGNYKLLVPESVKTD